MVQLHIKLLLLHYQVSDKPALCESIVVGVLLELAFFCNDLQERNDKMYIQAYVNILEQCCYTL